MSRAEEQVKAGDSKAALKTYRAAADTFSKIKQQWPSWQPELVEYRLKRTQEQINQLQGKMGPGTEDPSEVVVDVDPPLDLFGGQGSQAQPPRGKEVVRTPRNPKEEDTRSEKEPTDPIEKIRKQIKDLESKLDHANESLAAEQEKNAHMTKELGEAIKVRKDAEIERKKATDLADIYQKEFLDLKNKRDTDSAKLKELETQIATMKAKSSGTEANLAAAEERINQLLERSRTVAQRASEAGALPGKIKQLEAKLAEEQAAKKDLSDRLAGMTQERDEAKMEITRLKDANKQVDKLMADNAGLLKKLGDAEKLILTFRTESPQKDAEIAALKKQVTDSQKALEASADKNTNLQTEVGELRKKVDDYTKQIQQFKTDKTTSAEERRKMEEENKLLQGIVMRVLQEDANRSQRKKMVQKELDRLQIQSDVLLKQINFLTEPVVKLSSAERRLFKRPIIDVQDPNTIVAIKTDAASEPAAHAPEGTAPVAPTPGATASLPTPEPIAEGNTAKPGPMAKVDSRSNGDLPTKSTDASATEGNTPGSSAKAGAMTGGLSGLPEEVRPLAEQAKQAFEREKYVDAEKFYEKALQVAPSNLYLWSNKGVTQFRAGKFKNAEESFRKAIAIAPEDHFSWCTLGIVEYSQGKYDEAVNSLTKSLAINNKNATAHNYLGITAAQKGWIEAAQKELETAIQLDGKYADAWFNLAVTQTLKNPPNREEAKKAYQKALELGADVDPAMENLIK